jgi:hypothetical protein
LLGYKQASEALLLAVSFLEHRASLLAVHCQFYAKVWLVWFWEELCLCIGNSLVRWSSKMNLKVAICA